MISTNGLCTRKRRPNHFIFNTIAMARYSVERSWFTHFFLADTKSAWIWLIVRLYVGYEWLMAGWEKFTDPNGVWVGANAPQALTGFLQGALAKTAAATGSAHPDVQDWYAWFITHVALPNATVFSYLVTYGEMLVGIALILGFLTGISVFFGMFMNLNFMLAGTVSVNPIWFVLSLGIILAWRISGYYGLDRYVLPLLFHSLRQQRQ